MVRSYMSVLYKAGGVFFLNCGRILNNDLVSSFFAFKNFYLINEFEMKLL